VKPLQVHIGEMPEQSALPDAHGVKRTGFSEDNGWPAGLPPSQPEAAAHIQVCGTSSCCLDHF
ncbi:hypothetical protein, partial [Novosphingobium sp. Rr 2-17]|uniref:hypothetical protein n=1 Tax=Novosphingobium sp. Rr 2-17 TaxID=555793 RepID=UPI001ED9481E